MLEVEFIRTEEKMTGKIGLIPFVELINKMKLSELANQNLPKSSSNNCYEATSYFTTLLLMLYGGGDTLSDSRIIRDDHALRKIANLRYVPSESAIGDWLRRVGKDGADAIHCINALVTTCILKNMKVTSGTIVLDPTIIKAEKKDAAMTYLGHKGYRPAIAFLKELHLIINYEFRNGNDTGRRFEQLKLTLDKMPHDFKTTIVLCDSEFYQADIINELDERSIPWILVADQDTAVLKAIETIPSDEWQPFYDKDGIKTDREIAETVHSMEKTKKAFRLLVLRWKNDKEPDKYCYHCKASGIKTLSAGDIVLEYNQRAEEENTIKEVKNNFGAHKMPCGEFDANAVYFGFCVLAYNLFILQKLLMMPQEFAPDTIKTIRWKLINIPALVKYVEGKLYAYVDASREMFASLIVMRKKINAMVTSSP